MTGTPLLSGTDAALKREEIRKYFTTVYDRYELLFELLNCDEAFYQRPESLRHPLIFYFGHTAAFFVNKLKLAGIISKRIDPKLESIFAVGVDEMSWDDLNEAHYDWPEVGEAKLYRAKVKELVLFLIDTLPISLPVTKSSPWWVLLMGIEHENIHLETSSVLLRQLDIRYINPHEAWKICSEYGDAPQNELVPLQGGTVSLGKREDASLYGWDNEYGRHTNTLKEIEVSKYLVSNGEYLEFVEAGGYENDAFWSEEGLSWKRFKDAKHPTFWIAAEEGYSYRALSAVIPLPMNWPVDVNYLEAEAFCSWLGKKLGKSVSLPSEDEYMLLHQRSNIPNVDGWNMKAPANIDLEYFASAVPVDRFEHNGFYDVIGNVWQWSRTPIYPYDGFAVHPVYDDFTVPTYDNRHNLIKGGSWISCGNLADAQSRYAFRRHFFQHAGFRYVSGSNEETIRNATYEEDEEIALRCHASWGEEYFGAGNFYAVSARKALEVMGERPRRRALDLGCAAGRSAFELAREFESVTGIDFTARMILNAQEMKETGILRYAIPKEGEIKRFCEVDIRSFGFEEAGERVEFWQGDASNLKPIFTGYDLIIAHDILDRLYDPLKFLESMRERIVRGGLLIITSSYDWSERYTPKEKWAGALRKDGENYLSIEAMGDILGSEFRLVETGDIERVQYLGERRFLHTLPQMSIWERS